jgi:16S rRNA (guanine966-N2)-methyltransferase
VSLRVISGTAKGRRLRSVPGDTTRPITDRVKEALFNVVAADVIDSRWWDLFAGTGAVGIEALSRGAAFVRFSDLNRAPIETIQANLAQTRLAGRAETLRADAFSLLAARAGQPFHYIYVAPPQYHDTWTSALGALDANIGWLSLDGWVIAQIAPKEYREIALKNLQEFDQRRYGSTLLLYLERRVP